MKTKTFIVTSSHGQIITDSLTGKVLIVDGDEIPEPDDYLDRIASFDVGRYMKVNKLTEMPDYIDILRLGFTEKDGTYEDPVLEYENHTEHLDKTIHEKGE